MENAYISSSVILRDDEYVVASTIESKLRKLVEIDASVAVVNKIRPSVWSARWEYSSGQPYMAGDAVWVNTEDEYDFINSHCAEMYQYALGNDILRHVVVPYVKDDPSVFSLYSQMLSGYFDKASGTQLPPMYWLGNIEDPVQLRICVQDGTTSLPTDVCAWQDFFIGDDDNQQLLSDEFEAQALSAFNQHVSEYHLTGYTGRLSDEYALNDFSNIDADCIQRFMRHSVHSDISGFTYVARFEVSSYQETGGMYNKWYRLWSNGYLEQGGRVVLSAVDRLSDRTGDSALPSYVGVRVGLLQNYDYPTAGIAGQYDTVDSMLQDGIALSSLNDIGRHNRYVALVTCESPMQSADIPVQTTAFKNKSFDVVLSANARSAFAGGQAFNYYCSGFTNRRIQA